MYHQHFGLSGPPFQFTPTPDALYLSKTHREGLAALEWGLLREPTGFTVLIGESGIGKTTLVCSILARRYESVRAAFITNPRLTFEQLMQVALSQLAPGAGGRDKFELSQSFVQLLDDLAPGQRIALIIDESQELSEETLEELRLLANADTAAERRLQMIFVGQPELMERLASARMRSLNQRIGARALLKPLTPAEVREYVDCRLRAKGGAARKIFVTAALHYLIEHSHGIPRRINVLCHNAMLLGYASGARKVSLAMARNAVAEYEDLIGLRPPRVKSAEDFAAAEVRPARWVTRAALAVTALALAVLCAVYIWSAQTLLASAPAVHPSVAIRPAAGPKTTGPGVLLRPVAPATGADAPLAVAFTTSIAPVRPEPSVSRRASDARSNRARTDDAPSRDAASGVSVDARSARATGADAAAADASYGQAVAPADNRASESMAAHLRSIQVRYGDTLLEIATRYLGSPDALNRLLDVNPQLQDIDRIYPGQTVYLPPIAAVTAR